MHHSKNYTQDGLFCIYFDNYDERNYYNIPSLITDTTIFENYVSKYAGYNYASQQTGQSTINNFYKETFQTNNVVQLVSRASGHSLQIVESSETKKPVLDGCGKEGPQASNTLWTVVNEGKNQVRLHNNNNYIAIVNGITQLVNMPPGTMHGEETKIQLHQSDQFVTMESCKTVAQYVGVLDDGQLKSALATHRNDTHAMFGVRLISTPYDGAPGKQ
ncbi:unnamed protein product [Mytilus edulis]|uniref:Uncharacterized protein n=1 Tax=Mytilus edulis TaxID=6550 RepID=A0A8S3QYE0_MYTED|nr:unnamed protein product [Mytilus edulis]